MMTSKNKRKRFSRLGSAVAFGIFLACTAQASAQPQERLVVFTTIPDLADLALEVGGDQVETFSMVNGREDPHFAEPRPSFIKMLSRADLFIEIGMELEIGYAPRLIQSARNKRVLRGQPGNLVASSVIRPLQVPTTRVDRSMGDVHAFGNPHFLVDPVRGLQVAAAIRDRLALLRPASSDYFHARYDDLHRRTGDAIVGEALAKRYDWEKLVALQAAGGLAAFLEGRGESSLLGGWFAALAPYRGVMAVQDHRIWAYFAERFGVDIVADLEPVPGIPPTSSHLTEVIELMRNRHVGIVLLSPYYDPRHAEFVSTNTGAEVVRMAHQVGSVDGASTYLAMIDYNVRQLAAAAAASKEQ